VNLNTGRTEGTFCVRDVNAQELLGDQNAFLSELIPAKYVRNHSILDIIYRLIQLQLAEKCCLVVKHVSQIVSSYALFSANIQRK
jgi:hypothetical protein